MNLHDLVGQEVTVIPNRGVGESRDTEAGLQPWTATIVDVMDDGRAVVQQGDYEPHPVNGAGTVTRSGLQIGSYN